MLLRGVYLSTPRARTLHRFHAQGRGLESCPTLNPNPNPSMKTMNHTEYPKRLKSLDSHALRYIIKDCREAMASLPDNPNNGYYQDEIHYCVMELYRRKPKCT